MSIVDRVPFPNIQLTSVLSSKTSGENIVQLENEYPVLSEQWRITSDIFQIGPDDTVS